MLKIEQFTASLKQAISNYQPDNPVLDGWASYSEFDEDGIIRSCIRRISTLGKIYKTAVEIGCGDGKNNNTHQLLLDGYSAVWVDGSANNIDHIKNTLGGTVFPNLLVLDEKVNTLNAESIASDASNFLGSEEIDFFSLDNDGNNLHICAPFVEQLKPKLICVGYNAKFPPPTNIAIEYDASHAWSGDDYFGSSLQAWVDFFDTFDYVLVCCNLTGVNAFFIQKKYAEAFSFYALDELYQPPRNYLINHYNGYTPTLSWLRQVLKVQVNKTVVCGRSVAIAKTNYGHMAVYRGDSVIGKSLLDTGSFQENKISQVVSFLRSFCNLHLDLFVDIGANIGTHSIFALKQESFAKAIAFEPDIDNFKLLLKNVGINRLNSKVECHLLALTDRPKEVELELSDTNLGDHRIRPESPPTISFGEESERITRKVQAMSLDALYKELKFDWSNALLWIDTQGHEGQIFEGGNVFFSGPHGSKALVCEFWPYGIERSGSKSSYFDFLASCFAVHDINSLSWRDGDVLSMSELDEMYYLMLESTEKEYHPHTDLLLIPKQY